MIKVARVQIREPDAPAGACGALFLLAKPGIVAAVTLSGFTGMVVAGRGVPEGSTALSCLASLLMMAAGSALINNVLDRGIDRQMERLSRRSAALRRVGTATAVATALALTAGALLLCLLLLNATAALLLATAAVSYTVYYTLFLKRRSHWAAVTGALPGALPVLIGQAAVTPHADPASLSLFLIMLVWQPPHFWLMSLSHRDDYRAAGIPVLPLVKGEPFTRNCIYLGLVSLVPATLLLRYQGPCSAGYAICALALDLSYLISCHFLITCGANYRAAFRGSIVYLLLLFSIVIADLTL